MRQKLYLLFSAALIFSLTWGTRWTFVSSAQSSAPERVLRPEIRPAATVDSQPLPNYDVREDAKRQPLSRVSRLGAEIAGADLAQKSAAAASFRNRVSPGDPSSVQISMNDVNLPKMINKSGASLSRPQFDAPDQIARGFLAENAALLGLDRTQVGEMRLKNEDRDPGATFLNYEQMIDGVSVFEGAVQVAVDNQGQVMSVNEGMLIPTVAMSTTPRLSENEGLKMALLYSGKQAPASFEMIERRSARGDRALFRNPMGGDRENLYSEMKIMRVGNRAALAWHAYVEVGSNEWYEILTDANTGAMLYRANLYLDAAQGLVYRENPTGGARTTESFVGNTTINTAAGWLGSSTVTSGNNVDAYLDVNADNQPDATGNTVLQNGRAFSATQNFSFALQLGVNPRVQRAAAVTNLFYLNNIIHDYAYQLGFTEAAGNFQTNNFGRGGLGNDSVRAEAQDGSGTNNANFGAPPDGQRPRMQMFLFTRGTASLDDDLDACYDGDVVLHEYTHGISNRLVGGPANTSCLQGVQSGAMGEGWGDYVGISFYNEGLFGEYVTNNNTRGVRRAAYTVPAATVHDSYADLGNNGFEVHNDGEVWASTLWELRQTLGRAVTDRLVIQGMKLTPCRPSMLNARDAILMADQNLNGGANRCAIRRVFARHGMGVSAQGNDGTQHTAATDIPASCVSN